MKLYCAYHASDTCGQPIIPDTDSYSGYSHFRQVDDFGQPIDYCHWATPIPYGMGEAETSRIFVPCVVCGKLGSDNPLHIKFPDDGGHHFKAANE